MTRSGRVGPLPAGQPDPCVPAARRQPASKSGSVAGRGPPAPPRSAGQPARTARTARPAPSSPTGVERVGGLRHDRVEGAEHLWDHRRRRQIAPSPVSPPPKSRSTGSAASSDVAARVTGAGTGAAGRGRPRPRRSARSGGRRAGQQRQPVRPVRAAAAGSAGGTGLCAMTNGARCSATSTGAVSAKLTTASAISASGKSCPAARSSLRRAGAGYVLAGQVRRGRRRVGAPVPCPTVGTLPVPAAWGTSPVPSPNPRHARSSDGRRARRGSPDASPRTGRQLDQSSPSTTEHLRSRRDVRTRHRPGHHLHRGGDLARRSRRDRLARQPRAPPSRRWCCCARTRPS